MNLASEKGGRSPLEPMFSKPKPELSQAEKLAAVKKGGRLAMLDRTLTTLGEEASKKLGADKPRSQAAESRRKNILAEAASLKEKAKKEMLERKAEAAGLAIRGAKSDEAKRRKSAEAATEAQIEIAHRERAAQTGRKIKEKIKEAKMKYASYEVVQPPAEDEAIELAEQDIMVEPEETAELKKEDKSKLDRILEAYEEADSARIFTDWMLEHGDLPLSAEFLEKNSALAKYLKANFKEQKSGLRYEDLVDALPVQKDYEDKKRGQKPPITAQRQITKMIPPAKPAAPKIEAKITRLKPEEEMEETTGMQDLFKKAQAVYVKAYREFDPKFTENKPDDLVAVIRPPWLGFGAKRKELKNLFAAMNRARKNLASEEDQTKIEANLSAARAGFNRSARPLDPERRAALLASAKAEEEATGLKRFVDEESWYEPVEDETGINSALVRQSKKESAGSFLDDITLRRGEGIRRRLEEISWYFMKKHKMSAESVHKFLMGQEIKGLFKGGQKQMQKEYKALLNNPVYKEWLKLKGK